MADVHAQVETGAAVGQLVGVDVQADGVQDVGADQPVIPTAAPAGFGGPGVGSAGQGGGRGTGGAAPGTTNPDTCQERQIWRS